MYPQYSLSILKQMFFCKVVHVESASRVYLRNDGMTDAFQALQEMLHDYHEGIAVRGEVFRAGDLREGASCLVRHIDSVYRAVIVESDEHGFSEVVFVDYGTMDYVPSNRLYQPESIYAMLPPLCVECELLGHQWLDSEEITAMIEHRTVDQRLIAKVIGFDDDNSRPIIRLFDGTRRDIVAGVIEEAGLEVPYNDNTINSGFFVVTAEE